MPARFSPPPRPAVSIIRRAGDRPTAAGAAWVVDGDTLHFDGERVRIAGIDAPEMGQPMADGNGDAGLMAKLRLMEMLIDADVLARVVGTDVYGRTIASVQADGRDVGLAMVHAGYAVAAFDPPDGYRIAEAAARAGGDGLWGIGGFEEPAAYRHRTQRSGEQDEVPTAATGLAAEAVEPAPGRPASGDREEQVPAATATGSVPLGAAREAEEIWEAPDDGPGRSGGWPGPDAPAFADGPPPEGLHPHDVPPEEDLYDRYAGYEEAPPRHEDAPHPHDVPPEEDLYDRQGGWDDWSAAVAEPLSPPSAREEPPVAAPKPPLDTRREALDAPAAKAPPGASLPATEEEGPTLLAEVPERTDLAIVISPAGGGAEAWALKHYEEDAVLSVERLRARLPEGHPALRNEEMARSLLQELALSRLSRGHAVALIGGHLRKRERVDAVGLVPEGDPVAYVLVDRPLDLKVAEAARRGAAAEERVDAEHRRFAAALEVLAKGDEIPGVQVVDARVRGQPARVDAAPRVEPGPSAPRAPSRDAPAPRSAAGERAPTTPKASGQRGEPWPVERTLAFAGARLGWAAGRLGGADEGVRREMVQMSTRLRAVEGMDTSLRDPAAAARLAGLAAEAAPVLRRAVDAFAGNKAEIAKQLRALLPHVERVAGGPPQREARPRRAAGRDR